MSKSFNVTALLSFLISSLSPLLVRTATAGDARSLWEVSCMLRKDKFDYVLPTAMRRNGIDMWIVLDRGRGTEPMARDFGIDTVNGQGTFIFFDRGEGRIERIQLGYEVRPNTIISLEYRIFRLAKEWGGAKIGVNVEENALITERGIEWLYPPQERVLVIR